MTWAWALAPQGAIGLVGVTQPTQKLHLVWWVL